MDNTKITLESGAVLYISLAPFSLGHKLFKVVSKEMSQMSAGENLDGKLGLILLASEQVEEALWPCLARATYNGNKISPETFENFSSRKDFIQVAKEVLSFNLNPFFPSLGSLSKDSGERSIESQK